ncbi:hypothetical protein K502DRAFT_117737 [Neoconidiobolus thromboides FSU 785]|nr:hypothetical protein K502DRAFT_117737 [Neoconidiobolus thromboides FSU 785]
MNESNSEKKREPSKELHIYPQKKINLSHRIKLEKVNPNQESIYQTKLNRDLKLLKVLEQLIHSYANEMKSIQNFTNTLEIVQKKQSLVISEIKCLEGVIQLIEELMGSYTKVLEFGVDVLKLGIHYRIQLAQMLIKFTDNKFRAQAVLTKAVGFYFRIYYTQSYTF